MLDLASKSSMRKLSVLLYAVILIEGFVVLASELLAIRLLVSFVGSDTATISIIISAVLMPLAFGYNKGGQVYHQKYAAGKIASIRRLLLNNLAISAIILAFGLSMVFLEFFFLFLHEMGIESRIVKTAIYSVLFLSYPVFLLGQTTPLISNYFSSEILSKITGRMLFFSTVGSFSGAVISSLFLMHTIGVHNTVILNISLLLILSLLLSRKLLNNQMLVVYVAFGLTVLLNGSFMMNKLGIVLNDSYHTILIKTDKDDPETRTLIMNRTPMSKITPNEDAMYSYYRYIENHVIKTMPKDPENPKDILVVGAGGFTIGRTDKVNQYYYVDINSHLQETVEEHFLKDDLAPNQHYIVEPARAFLAHNTRKYDLVILDVVSNPNDIPFQLITHEYLQSVKDILKPHSVLIANMLISPDFDNDWSIKFDNTFRSVFNNYNRHSNTDFDPWRNIKSADGKKSNIVRNVMYTYYTDINASNKIYTDNINGFFLDR